MADLPPPEADAQKKQRLLEELVALIRKRRETRAEDWAKVDLQIKATEAELRKLNKAPTQ